MADDAGFDVPGVLVPDATETAVFVDALERVLASDTFRAAPKSRNLLSYVVTETIAGRGPQIKERMVARVALGRPATIDTRTDASGRVHTSRVRERLERYYEREGANDPIRISIPVGQYAATFAANVQTAAPPVATPLGARSLGPTLAVIALRPSGGGGSDRRTAIGLTESLVQAFSRFPELRVIGPLRPRPRAGDAPDVLDVGERAGADAVLYGRVRDRDDILRVTVHVADARTGEVRWSRTFDRRVQEFTGFGAEDDIVRHVVGLVGDYHGVVLGASGAAFTRSGDAAAYDALARYYDFADVLDPPTGADAARALEEVVVAEPDNPLLVGCLGSLAAIDVLLRGGVRAAASLARADELGRRTLGLDPHNAQGHAILAIVALAQGDLAAARRHADAVMALTPYHPSLTYLAGMVIGASGDWDAGIAVIRRVAAIDPYRPTHRRTLLAVDHLVRGDVAAALAEATLLNFPAHVYGPLLRGICYAELGMDDEARAEIADLVKVEPAFFEQARELLSAAPTIPDHVVDFLCDKLELLRPLAAS